MVKVGLKTEYSDNILGKGVFPMHFNNEAYSLYQEDIYDFVKNCGSFESQRFKNIFRLFEKTDYLGRFLDSNYKYKHLTQEQKDLLKGTIMLGAFHSNQYPMICRYYQLLGLGEPDETCVQLKQVIIVMTSEFIRWNEQYYRENGILMRNCKSVLEGLGINYKDNSINDIFNKRKIRYGLVSRLPKEKMSDQNVWFEPIVSKGMRYTTMKDINEFIMKYHPDIRGKESADRV